MAFQRFKFLLDQTDKPSQNNIVCALVTGWTSNERRGKAAEVKASISEAINEWLNITTDEEFSSRDYMHDLNIGDLEEILHTEIIEVLSKHGIHDLNIEILNTETSWRYDDNLAI